jgi:molecular chaperone GrpE
MSKNFKSPSASVSALNALELVLESQKFEAEIETMLQAMLPLLDAVERVCRDLDSRDPEEVLRKVEAIALLAEMGDSTVERLGLQRIAGIGEPAHPSRHEIVDVVAPSHSHSPGTIVEVVQFGWIYQGRLLRPAKVVAATPGANNNPSGESPENL